MAKKRTETPLNTCRDCKNCHSHYNTGYDGRMILGKCSKSEHSKLLNRDTCKEFENKGDVLTEKEFRVQKQPEIKSDNGQMALF